MTRLPLTVIGGYLGAGKTTLINRLLTGDHSKRLMVMVNDFGAVNIDAALIKSLGTDTLELTNGCVCCTMGADLFMAVGDVLDRPERPDHLIIEASGIADPARIAEVARTERELSYAGIVTVVDGLNFEVLLTDAQIAPQLQNQVSVSDLCVVSKTSVPESLRETLQEFGARRVLPGDTDLAPLLWDLSGDAPEAPHAHAHFVKWALDDPAPNHRNDLMAKLAARPAGLYRVKGFVPSPEGGMWEVQVVGKSVEVTASDYTGPPALVGIGPEGPLDLVAVNNWWAEV